MNYQIWRTSSWTNNLRTCGIWFCNLVFDSVHCNMHWQKFFFEVSVLFVTIIQLKNIRDISNPIDTFGRKTQDDPWTNDRSRLSEPFLLPRWSCVRNVIYRVVQLILRDRTYHFRMKTPEQWIFCKPSNTENFLWLIITK